MNLSSTTTDNITELLSTIIEFTHSRQKVLTANIQNSHRSDFVPMDLAVEEFSASLNLALNEYLRNQRLLLCDTENVKFGSEGTFEALPIEDKHASELLEEGRELFLELQINKLMENSINQAVAAELFRYKQETVSAIG